ncbi:alpha-amylase family protein [Cohnella nanjingensis]|uniref:Beta-galactosidase trimerization domain-containing protein n=1 Tax=Cohnella nanjingensis TaxID=1387779 RepID=A0A7X0RWI9_9BACL|nr:alpha-amylase family protein [Cohnella nanjingensis]MBB6674967.1 beta-galactosidase trimerization domain-containing protein [Cohnella nanjingensis]
MRDFDPIRFRQVHLDFHTSEHIEGVGADFAEDDFIGSLRRANVDTVNVFAMCHHGWSYFDTRVGAPHPHLATNLLPRMLDACKRHDIEAPVYITVGFNERSAREHPEWVAVAPAGMGRYGPPSDDPAAPRTTGFDGWHMMCLNTPYLDYIVDYTREVIERFDPVGIFYDIVGEYPCACEYCLRSLAEMGLEAGNHEHHRRLAQQVYLRYLQRTSELIWSLNPKTRLYHNCCTERMGDKSAYPYYSHYDIESLPSGGWGYDYFTSMARYIRNLDFRYLGMTGKFHKSWGEFGGFKSATALKFECEQMLAFGARICIGDQLHPSGRMDASTYAAIGEAFEGIADKEPWCADTAAVADIAILSAAAWTGSGEVRDSDMGAYMMLEESHQLFDIIDDSMDFSKYRVLILPDAIRVNDALRRKLEDYLGAGGKIMLSAESGLRQDEETFALDVGADYLGRSEWEIDYTQAAEDLAGEGGLVASPFLNYEPGRRIEPRSADAEIWASTWRPYFNRTNGHFCSHLHAPAAEPTGHPAVIRHGNAVYFAQPLFRAYRKHGVRLYRDLFLACLRRLLPNPTLLTDLPSAGKANLTRLPGPNGDAYVLHLLYAVPILRGDTQVIEDIPTLRDVSVRVKLDRAVREVRMLPDLALVPHHVDEAGYASVSVDVTGHRMIQFIV